MSSPQERKSPGGRDPGGSTEKKPGKKGQPSPQAGPSLQEIKRRGQRMRMTPEKDICDQLDALHLDKEPAAEGTGLVYDERMTQFFCLWDDKFPECPARLAAVREKLVGYGLLERCVPVPVQEASEEELLLVHSPEYIELMKSTQKMTEEELRVLSDKYDSVYLHPLSFASSCLAAGSVLQLVDKVMSREVRNGLAVVRPPGHHAHTNQMNGYCMFNQLAVAARYAQRQHGVKRVLIVDWDVHHGQGTQFIFEDDPSVLYFSIHRYENGEYWPHLMESSSAAVGKGRGVRYNINVPWNKMGMSDADYITAFLHLLLPVSYEFQPQLVLVAAGYDSVVGDPKGEMAATPACFAHLTHLLMSLAEGRLVLALEGGYNLRSLAEGTCASLKILLGDPCPALPQPCAPCESALDSISGAISVHRKYWRCLQDQDFTLKPEIGDDKLTTGESGNGSFPKESDDDALQVALDATMQEVMRKLPEGRTALVYNEQMMEHYNLWDSGHPELPQRITRIFQQHKDMGLVDRCTRLPHRLATTKELQMCHSLSYINKMKETSRMKPRDLHRMGSEYNSIFINNRSYHSACLAAGCTFNVVEAVLKGKVQNGVCIVRPPGHHAESDAACGFCFFNSVALAARYAQSLQSPSEPPLRVMILDWDIHHGNGTQHMFQDDPSVLYVSLHRYDNGLFFPSSEDAAHDRVGHGPGEGFNVNIPWNGGKMGDSEYLLAFHRIVMPIAYEFNPQLVLVSAGFDAARGDPLGGCRISPEGYAHMTHLLMGLAGGRLVLVLEGGYNLTSISDSMSMCTRTLLGDPPPTIPELYTPRPAALRAISSVLGAHQKYWRSLRINVGSPLPSEVAKEILFSPEKMQPSKDAERRLSSPQQKSSGDRTVATPSPQKPDVMQQEKDHLTPEQEKPRSSASPVTKSVSPRTSIIQDGEARKKDPSLENLGGDSLTSTKEVEIEGGTYSEKDDDNTKPNQSCEGESLELVIELQVSDKPQWEPGTEIAVEGLLKDLHLGSDSGSADVRCLYEDSKPVGGARKKTMMGRQSAGGQFTDRQPNTAPPAEAARSDHLLPCDMEPALGISGELFTVTPLPWCPHLESVCALPPSGLDVTEPCAVCGTQVENWVCLTCYQVLCGRYVSQHMMYHGVSCGHNIVLSFSDLSVWCYSCDAYVHNEVLLPAKCSAYRSKFKEEMPGI